MAQAFLVISREAKAARERERDMEDRTEQNRQTQRAVAPFITPDPESILSSGVSIKGLLGIPTGKHLVYAFFYPRYK